MSRLPLPVMCLLLAAAGILLSGTPVRAVEGAAKGYTLEFRRAMNDAIEAFTDRDFTKAEAALATADKIVPATVFSLNIHAAIEIERGRYPQGERYCRAVLQKDPKFFPARFNLGEIQALQKHYAAARAIFQEIQKDDPGNDLLQYRIIVTYLMENNDAAAQELLGQMKFPCDSGAYYYANAAWAFAHGDKAGAEVWIRDGDWVFSHRANTELLNVFYDVGWMQRPVPMAMRAAEASTPAPAPAGANPPVKAAPATPAAAPQ